MIESRRGELRGVVQGVGFRPFVVGLGRRLGLRGRVGNRGGVVIVEVEGPLAELDAFAAALVREAPAAAKIESLRWSPLGPGALPREHAGFTVAASEAIADGALAIGPDLRLCSACAAEVADPSDRRWGYALDGCTACGPRLSIATGSPWSRERSSMASFPPCPACAREHADPQDRRFHAEAIACPDCGPRLRLEDLDGRVLAGPGEAIAAALALLGRGGIVGLQGIGGFQLVCDARDQAAVLRLRERKRRPAKPLAVMVADLGAAAELALLEPGEAEALAGSAGPIVLVRRRPEAALAEAVAPGRPTLGLLLATTPAHALLLAGLGAPLVATSGNVHERPIALTPTQARAELRGIADALLVHDRVIQRRCDDSVVQVVDGRVRVLRLGRGLAPTRIVMPEGFAGLPPMLGLGAQLGQAPVLLRGRSRDSQAIAWPHVGDLDEPATRAAMAESIADLCRMLDVAPEHWVVDAHPDYASSLWAREQGGHVHAVFHHHAHVAAVLAEHGRTAGLGVAWDGTGLGPGHAPHHGLWGGEFLAVDPSGARRVAHLLPYPLPGGDAAARDGLRPLAGLLHASGLGPGLADELAEPELARLLPLAANPRLAPPTSSVGRLFDAVAAVTGICRRSRYQAEAAQALELAASPGAAPYPFTRIDGAPLVLDWRPMLRPLLAERHDPGLVASRFHATLIAMIVSAVSVVEQGNAARQRPIVLSGGCFANRLLLAGAAAALRARGFEVLAPERLPPGDGGLALGQLWVAGHRLTCARIGEGPR